MMHVTRSHGLLSALLLRLLPLLLPPLLLLPPHAAPRARHAFAFARFLGAQHQPVLSWKEHHSWTKVFD